MNLFVGVMCSSFTDAIKKEEKKGIQDNKEAEKYLDYISQISQVKPEYQTFKKKTNKIQVAFSKITNTAYFDNFILAIILCNLVTIAIDFEGSSDNYTKVLTIFNYIFTAIFIIECILKLLANGFSRYFYIGWNKFDFFVVIASIIDLYLTLALNSRIAFLKSFQILRVLRVLRVTRVFRLVKTLKGLEKLIQTLSWSLQALGNVLLLLFLVFCIFSVLGYYVFDFTLNESNNGNFNFYDADFNFNNFYHAYMLVLRTTTGEDWPSMMKELAQCK